MPAPRMIVLSAVCLLGLLTAVPAPAQTADEIVEKHVDARGGREALQAVRSMRIRRTVVTVFSTIEVTVHRQRPARYRIDQEAPGQPPVIRAVNEHEAWESAGGSVTKRPAELELEARESDGDFDGPLVDHRAKGHTVALEGREAIPGGGEAYRLRVTMKSGDVRLVFLDGDTFLERKVVRTVRLPDGRSLESTVTFGDYRDVGGIMIPFAIEEERPAPGQTFVTYTHDVELNVPVAEEFFRMPASGTP